MRQPADFLRLCSTLCFAAIIVISGIIGIASSALHEKALVLARFEPSVLSRGVDNQQSLPDAKGKLRALLDATLEQNRAIAMYHKVVSTYVGSCALLGLLGLGCLLMSNRMRDSNK